MFNTILFVFSWLISTIILGQETVEAVKPTLVENIIVWADLAAQGICGMMIVATILTRLIPGTKDDILVNTWNTKLQKFLAFLPTFGINPRTKKLEEHLNELNK